jgi:hypothetical protein
MSSGFPTSYVRRFDYRASHPIPYTREQWMQILELARYNNWSPFPPFHLTVVTTTEFLGHPPPALVVPGFIFSACMQVSDTDAHLQLYWNRTHLVHEGFSSDNLYIFFFFLDPDELGDDCRVLLFSIPSAPIGLKVAAELLWSQPFTNDITDSYFVFGHERDAPVVDVSVWALFQRLVIPDMSSFH